MQQKLVLLVFNLVLKCLSLMMTLNQEKVKFRSIILLAGNTGKGAIYFRKIHNKSHVCLIFEDGWSW